MNISDKLKMLRAVKGLSLEELAEQVGITRQALHKYEKGIALPTLPVAKELAKVFGISIDELVA